MSIRRQWLRDKGVFIWIAFGVAVFVALSFVFEIVQTSARREFPPNAFYEVKRGDLLISVVEEGALRALNETVVRSSLEGFVRVISLAPEGSLIKKGELLVELDSSALKDRINEQEINYQDGLFQLLQAKENLKIQKSLAESQIKDAELKVEFAQTDLEKYRDADAPLVVRTAIARIGVLQEQVRIANERYDRTQELFKNGNATKSEVEADDLIRKREQLGLQQYEEDLRLIKKFDQPNNIRMLESNLQQAKDELERLKQRGASEAARAEADLETSQKALDILERTLAFQRRQLDNARILAPQDGLVVYSAISLFQGRLEGGRSEGSTRARDSGLSGMRDLSAVLRGGGGERRRRSGGGGSGLGMEGSSGTPASASSSVSSRSATGTASGTINSSANPSSSVNGATTSSAATGSAGSTAVGSAGAASGSSGRQGTSAGNSAAESGGQRSSGSGPAFTSFSPIRQNSSPALRNSAGQNPGASSSVSGSSAESGGQGSYFAGGPTSARSSGQSLMDRGAFEMPGSLGVLEEGAMVRQRQELIRLPDVSRMLVEVKVSESRVRQVHAGMLAFVRVETLPGRTFKGTVRKVGVLPDAQASWMNPDVKVYATDILIEDELPALKPGVSARAEIVITNLSKVLSVPIQAVTMLNAQHVCYARRGSTVSPVAVTPGWFNERLIEITSGLKEGDRILLAPPVEPEAPATESANGKTNEVVSVETGARQSSSRGIKSTE